MIIKRIEFARQPPVFDNDGFPRSPSFYNLDRLLVEKNISKEFGD